MYTLMYVYIHVYLYIHTYVAMYTNLQVISNQCEKRNARTHKPVIFDITDGEMLCISSIDFSRVNDNEWQIDRCGKLNVSNNYASCTAIP